MHNPQPNSMPRCAQAARLCPARPPTCPGPPPASPARPSGTVPLACALAVRSAPNTVSRLGCALYCNTMPSLQQPSSHNTLDYIAIQSSIPLAASVIIQYPVLQYNFSSQPTTHPCNTICCIAIQLPAKPTSSCNTISALQYNFFFSQYN